ncbi:SspB-related isopeptide-forming adhesin, partial [Leuconostoc gasicomitatum]|uniref:SspB-related isopeptide-forming adhesin n=1 Tax=Leuconostoc gasicomitatum TaxID=115778 RepID=UPI001CC5D4DD
MTNNIKNKRKMIVVSAIITAGAIMGLAQPLMTHAVSADNNKSDKAKGTNVSVDHAELDKSVAAAKKSGMTVTQNATKTQVISASQFATESAKIKADYTQQKSVIDALLKKQQAQNDSYDKDEAQYKTDKAKYDQDKTKYDQDKAKYDKDKAQYDIDEAAFKKATDVKTELSALTQNHDDHDKYDTFMKADVNQKTGDFTLTHDMNDGVSIIGHGVLKGKFNWTVTAKGDGSEVIVADSVTLTSYKYTNENPNTAVNKKINFHVYDNNGKELFVVNHDGESTFTKDINQTVSLGKSFTLKPNVATDLTQILKVDDNWIYNTHGQIFAKFTNTNKEPKAPTPPVAPTPPKEPAKPAPLTGNYGFTDLIVTPKPTKDVDTGDNDGDKTSSDDGKKIVKGEALTYTLKSTDLPADRTDDVKTFKFVDKLPSQVDYKLTKVMSADGKTDLSKQFDIKYDKASNTVTVIANADYLKLMNADKTKAFVKPIVNIHTVANQDNVTIDNKYTEWVNDDSNDSNTTHNDTPDIKPVKKDEDDKGNDINGKEVKPGAIMNYDLTWDLTGLKDAKVSDDLLAKGLSFYDDYDETKLNITDETKKNFTITDTTTKKSVMDEVTLTWDIQKGKWTTTAKDTAAFLKAHGGNKLQIMFHPVVKDDATGVLKNTAVQNDFGQEYQTDTVENNITPD